MFCLLIFWSNSVLQGKTLNLILGKIIATPIFVKIMTAMEAQQSTKKYWIYFFIWFAILVFMLYMPQFRQFFWLALPGTATHFAKAMDIM